jgi:putative membrane protein
MMWGYDGFGFGGGAMGIGMLLFWGLIIVVIVLLVRGFGVRPGASEPGLREKTALDILGERYARGEIDKTEFEEKRRDLEGTGRGT